MKISFISIIHKILTISFIRYSLPSVLPAGCGVWAALFDSILSVICFPCSLAQMSRHIFQYNRWNPSIGLFIGDPTKLPPLEAVIDRPVLADEAGLAWTDNRRLPGAIDYSGAAARRDMLANGTSQSNGTKAQQQQQSQQSTDQYRPPVATNASAPIKQHEPIYRPDGSQI